MKMRFGEVGNIEHSTPNAEHRMSQQLFISTQVLK
jgi:hypothetical protein